MTALLHDPQNVLHAWPGHPERLERYTSIVAALGRSGLLSEVVTLAPRPATDEEILAVHETAMIARIEQAARDGGGQLDPDTYCTAESWDIARGAAGGLIDLCAAVARGDQSNGLALLRPPGHHATRSQSMGFCLINNVAIAARALQSSGQTKRLAILDFDVHHGNGTEDIFTEDPTVFFASSHQFPHYPGTGKAADSGCGPGSGFTLNVPLAEGSGDEGFLAAYHQSIIPAVRAFQPELILVSAGYDAHRDDPLAGLQVSDEGFKNLSSDLIQLAQEVCSGKIVFCLEGGYNLEVLGRCVTDAAGLLISAVVDP